ncbi:MAG: translation initiation factor IF-2 [Candidatus Krumholzibacteria bacterium]|nr:translation initiation factor IF-2 [Candidatus Krumholzibacteria bacterium]
MAKVRVYELARKYEISSEALRKILVKEGITVKSHMSTIDDKVVMLIEQHLKRVRAATSREVRKKGEGKPVEKGTGRAPQKGAPQKGAPQKGAPQKGAPQKGAPQKGAPAPPARADRKTRGKKPKKGAKRAEADQKAVKESVKRTLAKLEVARKSRRRKRKEDVVEVAEEKDIVKLPEYSTVADLAEKLGIDPAEIIQRCLALGLMVSINQRLDSDTIEMIADEYGHAVKFVTAYGQDMLARKKEIAAERLAARPPVVTIMGHVDHGKTSLLDNIRRSNIIAGEKGGITQHIGAYEVEVKGRTITFIDTPGHKAFTAMRSRGARSTDIVVLIVAADDGVMPQTIEAINHARAADVPIIVAINKIDLPNADIEKVKRELLQQNIVLEEYGGNVMGDLISAKTGEGVEHLLEMILLQAEMMELQADPGADVRGVVIEARKEEGRGNVVTVLIQQGTLRVGDIFITGNHFGRVRALLNERGSKIDAAPPAYPVVVLGCTGVPQAGDAFYQVDDEKTAKEISGKRRQFAREKDIRTGQRMSLEDLYRQIQEGAAKELNLILRADTDGSAEALADNLDALGTDEVRVNVLQRAVGMINESDILLASASNAVVIGFNVPIAPQAQQLARSEKVDVRFYDVIYQVLDDVKAAMSGLLEPEIVEKPLGEAQVRQVFEMSRIGTIAGSYVTSGLVRRNALVRVRRDGEVVHQGTINSLKRFKDDVREVQAGFECGIEVEGFPGILEGDILEIYVEEEKHRTID